MGENSTPFSFSELVEQTDITKGDRIEVGMRCESNLSEQYTSRETIITKVCEKIGLSHTSYRLGKKVAEKAQNGDTIAQREWKKLQRGEQSITGAYEYIKRHEENGDDIYQTELPELNEWQEEKHSPCNAGSVDLDPVSEEFRAFRVSMEEKKGMF